MVNRHLFPNTFSVDQAKKSLPAIIPDRPPTVPKDTHTTEAMAHHPSLELNLASGSVAL
jgi:hypothetical protein